jgi:antitoxin CptB
MSEITTLRKKLLFRSNHRGTKEMDILLGRFADINITSLTDQEVIDLEELINENDPDLYNWITGKISPPTHYQNSLMHKLQKFTIK